MHDEFKLNMLKRFKLPIHNCYMLMGTRTSSCRLFYGWSSFLKVVYRPDHLFFKVILQLYRSCKVNNLTFSCFSFIGSNTYQQIIVFLTLEKSILVTEMINHIVFNTNGILEVEWTNVRPCNSRSENGQPVCSPTYTCRARSRQTPRQLHCALLVWCHNVQL